MNYPDFGEVTEVRYTVRVPRSDEERKQGIVSPSQRRLRTFFEDQVDTARVTAIPVNMQQDIATFEVTVTL